MKLGESGRNREKQCRTGRNQEELRNWVELRGSQVNMGGTGLNRMNLGGTEWNWEELSDFHGPKLF